LKSSKSPFLQDFEGKDKRSELVSRSARNSLYFLLGFPGLSTFGAWGGGAELGLDFWGVEELGFESFFFGSDLPDEFLVTVTVLALIDGPVDLAGGGAGFVGAGLVGPAVF